MPTTTRAYGAPSAKAKLEPMTIERREPGLNDVAIDIAIDIAYAGICHTDVHQTDEAWGEAIFPMVPGHEITGLVQAVGSGVTKFRVGDRVGVGTYIDSCRECENCIRGLEVYCTGPGGSVPTYNSRDRNANPNQGGYSKHIVVDERYVVRIPNELGLRRRGSAAVRRHHHLLRPQALERRAEHERGGPRHGRAGAHRCRARARPRRPRPASTAALTAPTSPQTTIETCPLRIAR